MKILRYIIALIITLSVNQIGYAQMSGYKIGIDPGHGGTDPGALGINGSALPDEADIVLNVSKEIQQKFQNLGATVVMTRTTDQTLSLSFRANLMNQQNPDAYVSVHENSFTSSSANGTETFRHTNAGSNSVGLATSVQAKMVEDMGFTNRGVKNARFTAIGVNASIPAALTEGCFISNTNEWNYITQTGNQICHANAIKNGILDYLGLGNLINLNCTSTNPPPSNSGNIAPSGFLFDVTSELSGTYGAAKAFDGTTSTRWNSNGVDNFNYFVIQLDKDYSVNKFVVKHASTAGLSVNLNTQRYRIFYWNGSGWVQTVNYNNTSKLGTTTHNVSVPITKWVALVIDDPTFTSDKYARIPEFEVYGTAVNGRLSNSHSKTPDMQSFEKSNLANAAVSAHPNIVINGKVQFQVSNLNQQEATLFIKNANGQLLKNIHITNDDLTIKTDLSKLPSGIYFYYLETSLGNFSKVEKLVIQ